jgi:hypothetical protein
MITERSASPGTSTPCQKVRVPNSTPRRPARNLSRSVVAVPSGA